MGKFSISTVFLALRLDRGLSQHELAALSGLSAGTFTRLENGQRAPRESTLRLALKAMARVQPFTAHEINRLSEATGQPSRFFESMNTDAARYDTRAVDPSDTLAAELAAVRALVPTEQLMDYVRSLRVLLQSAARSDAVEAFTQVHVSGDVPEPERQSVAERLYHATKTLASDVGPRGGRMVRVLGPERPGPIPGTVVQDVRYYEADPDENNTQQENPGSSGHAEGSTGTE